MIVSELIEYLKTLPQDLQVAYYLYSEQCLMTEKEIKIIECCEARINGWIQSKRKDIPSKNYLMFPGN